MSDNVNDPVHYPIIAGVKCADIAEALNFNLGNAIKYIWRCGLKGDAIEDLQKARWYIDREIVRLTNAAIANELRAIGKDCPECLDIPQSRGTTSAQLTAMHLDAETRPGSP